MKRAQNTATCKRCGTESRDTDGWVFTWSAATCGGCASGRTADATYNAWVALAGRKVVE